MSSGANNPVMPPGRAPPEPPRPGCHVTAAHRTTIFVRDQERSLELYRDLLGMKIFFDNCWNNEGINAIMGTEGETLRAVVLEASDGLYGKLGLYQLSAASVAEAGPPDLNRGTNVGDVAIVFVTDRIDDLAARVKAAGHPIVSEPAALWRNPDYEVQGREMLFRDPDGVLVNLVQPGTPKRKAKRQTGGAQQAGDVEAGERRS